ncbi:MAG: GntR family transcriptional regulator [Planctomycetota bacterium]
MALLRVDPTRPEPLFQQLVDSVKDAVARGALRPGDQLPSVRELARELVINPNTIAKAYRTLESDGVTYSRRGAGTFIAERGSSTLRPKESKRRLREGLARLLADAHAHGLDAAAIEKLFHEALAKFDFAEEATRE